MPPAKHNLTMGRAQGLIFLLDIVRVIFDISQYVHHCVLSLSLTVLGVNSFSVHAKYVKLFHITYSNFPFSVKPLIEAIQEFRNHLSKIYFVNRQGNLILSINSLL